MRKHDLNNKKTTTKTNTKTKTIDKDNDEDIKRTPSIFETFHFWDIWSEWWGNMTWPTKKTTTKTKTNTKTMTMTNTFREHLQRGIIETFNLWDISSMIKKIIDTFRGVIKERSFYGHADLEYLELWQFLNFCDVFTNGPKWSKIRKVNGTATEVYPQS